MASCKTRAYDLGVHRVSLGHVQATHGKWKWDDYATPKSPMHEWVSFTSLLYHPDNHLLYCGLTSWQCKNFFSFDPETKEFTDLGFDKIGDRFDVKIHRSFELDDDGAIVSATAGMHSYTDHPEAPGGKLFTYDPKTGKYELLGTPSPNDYIQSIALDRKRKVIYGNGYPLNTMWGFDMKTRKPFPMKWIGGHKLRCDNEGCLWGQSSEMLRWPGINEEAEQIAGTVFKVGTRSPKLYKYTPDAGYTVFDSYLYPVNGQNPSIANMRDGGDGYMYIGGSNGALYRVNKKSGECTFLALASPGGRLEGLDFGKNGLLYLGGGSFYCTRVAVYDRETGKVTDLGPIFDPKRDETCIIVHALAVTDGGTIYIGETDNCERSGFLWECKPKL